MNNEFTVIVKDSNGNTFKRSWKKEADIIDAIRWTITSEDISCYVNIDENIEITIK
jgi:hypothetical protein